MPSQTLPLNLEKPQHLLNFDQIKVSRFSFLHVLSCTWNLKLRLRYLYLYFKWCIPFAECHVRITTVPLNSPLSVQCIVFPWILKIVFFIRIRFLLKLNMNKLKSEIYWLINSKPNIIFIFTNTFFFRFVGLGIKILSVRQILPKE